MTIEQLARILPRAPAAWLYELSVQPPNFGIETPHEMASFIAQVAHESDQFTRLEENLSYSAERLAQVWPRFALNPGAPLHQRLPNTIALKYARNSVALANYVYANRNGNGDETSGDGWRFHGRGPVQLTFRANYARCAAGTGDPVLAVPDLLVLQPRIGMRAACWYWRAKKLDLVDDDDDVTAETRIINGGELGLAERQAYFNKALSILTEATA